MSYALSAELHGYPGPLHVLELAGALGLSEEQQRTTRHVFERMQRQAQDVGAQLIEDEAALDRLFGERKATPQSVLDSVTRAAHLQGRLRNIHLQAHMTMMALLTPAQTTRYQQLRGYR